MSSLEKSLDVNMAVGSLPSTSVSEKKEKPRRSTEVCREKAIQELVDTEVTYNSLLGLLIAHYIDPLSNYKIISNEQHSTLFPQLFIIKGLSDKFLEDLRKRRGDWDISKSKLSDLFETFTPYFRMYQGYVNNHEKSVALLRKLNDKDKWIEYCNKVSPLCHRFDLARYASYEYNLSIHIHLRMCVDLVFVFLVCLYLVY